MYESWACAASLGVGRGGTARGHGRRLWGPDACSAPSFTTSWLDDRTAQITREDTRCERNQHVASGHLQPSLTPGLGDFTVFGSVTLGARELFNGLIFKKKKSLRQVVDDFAASELILFNLR